MRENLVDSVLHSEEGHAIPGLASLAGAAGAVVLAIGAANDSGATTVIGGIVLAGGFLAYTVLNHMGVDYDMFGRLEKLEGKDPPA
jgi:uncharacterized membrane protein YebE (DUF533 family)